ncbi:MAG: hypothetical protein Q4B26_20550 [Eubacteriales bacterium]|nr:hypothetical protein [Eubacteriales bacterium]
MKKEIVLGLSLALGLSMLTACGNDSSHQANSASTGDAQAEEAQAEEAQIEDAEAEDAAVDESVDTTIYHFGETVTTGDGMFEFTPVFEGFADKLANWPDSDYLTPDGQFSGQTPYEAADEKVMMYFSGTIEYVGESKQNESFAYDFTIDYDDGYIFEFANGEAFNRGNGYHSGCGMIVDPEEDDWKYTNIAAFEPLSSSTTRQVRFCIEVPYQIEENIEKTIITFHLNGEDHIFSFAD